MKHYRTHYETVLRSICRETGRNYIPTEGFTDFGLVELIGDLIMQNNCIPFSINEKMEISESME